MAVVLPNRDVSYLDALLLDDQGRLKVVPSEVYERLDWTDLRIWCHLHDFYGLPTTELVTFLRGLLGGRSAIEVGAGHGALGRALGIPITDSKVQEIPEVRLLYALQGQPTIDYPSDVEHLDALDAIQKYKPQVVIGSWVTQTSDGTRPGCMYGIDEEAVLDRVESYVVFGSLKVHGGDMKVISSRPHVTLRKPWMWSRAPVGDSALFIWGKQGS